MAPCIEVQLVGTPPVCSVWNNYDNSKSNDSFVDAADWGEPRLCWKRVYLRYLQNLATVPTEYCISSLKSAHCEHNIVIILVVDWKFSAGFKGDLWGLSPGIPHKIKQIWVRCAYELVLARFLRTFWNQFLYLSHFNEQYYLIVLNNY